jgi:hypothetical protein
MVLAGLAGVLADADAEPLEHAPGAPLAARGRGEALRLVLLVAAVTRSGGAWGLGGDPRAHPGGGTL